MKIITLFMLLSSYLAFGHGENKPGPHGGHIRMPGNFHTEVVIEPHSVNIYLLNMAFKEPMTKDSSVVLKAFTDGKSIAGHCVTKSDHFECHLPDKISKYTKLSVNAVRKSQKGREAVYLLPLEFKNKAITAPAEDHSHHH